MATYREIPNSSIQSGSPVSVQLLSTLVDNQEAIREGVPDAPKIKPSGLFNATSTADTKTNLIFGASVIKILADGDGDVASDHFYVARDGQYTTHLVTVGDSNSHARIKFYKDTTLIATTATSSGTQSTYRQDTFAAGDKISIKVSDGNTGTTWNSARGYIFIYVNNPFGEVAIPTNHMIFGAIRTSSTNNVYGGLTDTF